MSFATSLVILVILHMIVVVSTDGHAFDAGTGSKVLAEGNYFNSVSLSIYLVNDRDIEDGTLSRLLPQSSRTADKSISRRLLHRQQLAQPPSDVPVLPTPCEYILSLPQFRS